MLDHLEQQCLALTARDKKIKLEDVNLLWDCNDDIETYFVKAEKLEENFAGKLRHRMDHQHENNAGRG